jgi:inner membrane protein
LTAPTHIAFAMACGLLSGSPAFAIKLLAGGALLPDIDHPQSAIGRIFFFISYPLNRTFGHRRHVHSLVVWIPFTIAGFFFYKPIGWIGLGAISHVIIDSWNLSGVAMMLPFSEKIFVLASKKYRIRTSSKAELTIMVVLGLIAWGGGYMGSTGGIRALMAAFFGSYEMAIQHYEFEGTGVAYLKGKLRKPDGNIVVGKWLIIGTEGKDKIAVYDKENNEVIHIPKDAKFLRATLKSTKEKWNTIKIAGPATIVKKQGIAFFKAGNKWNLAEKEGVVMGYVIHKGELEIEKLL